MSVSFYSVLGLSQNFTLEELETAYKTKTNAIMENNSISEIEQHLLLVSLKKYFDQAYMNLARRNYFSTESLLTHSLDAASLFRTRLPAFDTLFSDFPSIPISQDPQTTTVYSSSSSYREKTLPDGSKVVLKETSSNRNGDVSRSTNSYRQLATGTTEPIEYEQALQQFENKILM